MPRIAFVMTIHPGTEAEYDQRHRQVWPEMLAELRAAGAQRYSLFRAGTTLFAYLEVADIDRYRAYLAQSAVALRWEQFMSDILVRSVDAATQFPPLLPEVFHLEEPDVPHDHHS